MALDRGDRDGARRSGYWGASRLEACPLTRVLLWPLADSQEHQTLTTAKPVKSRSYAAAQAQKVATQRNLLNFQEWEVWVVSLMVV